MKNGLLAAIVGVFVSTVALADDWPQFRGPDRSGVSKEKGLLTQWPQGGLKPAWVFKDAGLGFSTVSVVKGVVYTLGTDKDFKDEYIIAIDEKKGTEIWRAKFAPLFAFKENIWGDGPRSTPTIDGNLLYALNGDGELVCVDVTQKGKEVWRKNLKKDFGGDMMTQWGYSESPLIEGDLLICTPGGKNGTVAALEKKTGKIVWQSKKWIEKAPYSSGIVADIQGKRQFVQAGYTNATEGGLLAGVDVKTGDLLWSGKVVTGNSYSIGPTPIAVKNQVYFTSSDGCHLIEIDAKQDATEKYTGKFAKNIKKLKNRDGGVVLIDGCIYGHSESQMWVCQDLKTGNQKWAERNEFVCTSGAIVAADGMLVLYSDDGEVALVPADPEGFALKGSFKLPERSKIPMTRPTSLQSKTWAHPVIANGHLFVRDTEYIFAFKIVK